MHRFSLQSSRLSTRTKRCEFLVYAINENVVFISTLRARSIAAETSRKNIMTTKVSCEYISLSIADSS